MKRSNWDADPVCHTTQIKLLFSLGIYQTEFFQEVKVKVLILISGFKTSITLY